MPKAVLWVSVSDTLTDKLTKCVTGGELFHLISEAQHHQRVPSTSLDHVKSSCSWEKASAETQPPLQEKLLSAMASALAEKSVHPFMTPLSYNFTKNHYL